MVPRTVLPSGPHRTKSGVSLIYHFEACNTEIAAPLGVVYWLFAEVVPSRHLCNGREKSFYFVYNAKVRYILSGVNLFPEKLPTIAPIKTL